MLYKVHTREGNYVVELKDPVPMIAPPGVVTAWDVIESILNKQIVTLEKASVWVKV